SEFIHALESIHRAGVRHRDLRIENMTINHQGTPFIIDFDRSALNASQDSRDREREDFLALLNGKYEKCLSYDSANDSDESES
ncbi:hypothetical protein H0H92_000755, partial [Tricholoma furcatifolium]